MKLTSHLVRSRKIVLGAVSLLSLASFATAAQDRHSILNQARYDSDAFSFNRSVLSPSGSLFGAVTLDEAYTFDFATAGIGTLIFRARSNRIISVTPVQDMPRAVANLNSSYTTSLGNNFFFQSPGFYRSSGEIPMDDQSVDGPGPIVAVPEPSTWFGALFALVAIAFTQRRRLHGLVARRA